MIIMQNACKCKQMLCVLMDKIYSFRSVIETKERAFLWVAGFFYKLILDIYYCTVVCTYWARDGFSYSTTAIRYLLLWIVYFVGYACIMQIEDKIVFAFMQIQWIFTITPIIVISGLQDQWSTKYIFYILLVVIVQSYVGNSKNKWIPISFGTSKQASYIGVILCIFAVSVLAIMMLWNNFAGFKAFDLTYIYRMRSHLVFPPFFGYFVSWTTRAIIPWLLLMGLNGKSKLLIILSFVLQLLFYMMLGYKAPILFMGIILIVFVLNKFNILMVGTYSGMLFAILLGTIGGCIEKSSFNKVSIFYTYNSILGERTLFVPAMIKNQFYAFFSVYPKAFFSDGMVGKMFSLAKVYKNSLGYTVYAYNNGGSLAAESNTGYLADSYAQMGLIGMLLIGLLTIVIVKIISSYQNRLSTEILFSIIFVFGIALNDGALFTILLTGGIGIVLVLMAIFAKRSQSDGQLQL